MTSARLQRWNNVVKVTGITLLLIGAVAVVWISVPREPRSRPESDIALVTGPRGVTAGDLLAAEPWLDYVHDAAYDAYWGDGAQRWPRLLGLNVRPERLAECISMLETTSFVMLSPGQAKSLVAVEYAHRIDESKRHALIRSLSSSHVYSSQTAVRIDRPAGVIYSIIGIHITEDLLERTPRIVTLEEGDEIKVVLNWIGRVDPVIYERDCEH